ncbi:MAG: hypothetical protein LBK60_10865 [Verrucomicrobiales bacterium]|jgi:hypothetical protein|nr:hypothetical protein [Verrucomicrobiales bacterium]
MILRLHRLLLSLTVALTVSAQEEELPVAAALPAGLQIISPRGNEILDSPPVDIFFDLKNIILAESGCALRVIVDNHPPLTLYSTARPLTLTNLADGGHTIRAWLIRPDGTAIRSPQAQAMVRFFLRKKDFQNFIDRGKPYFTVNLPAGDSYDTDISGQLYVDLLLNAAAQAAGCQVRYIMERHTGILDGRSTARWPGLMVGKHKLVLELLDSGGHPILGPFNRVERYFEIRQLLKATPMSVDGDNRPIGQP